MSVKTGDSPGSATDIRSKIEGREELTYLYALVGSVTSIWSHLETSVAVTIWHLANVDHRLGACMTSQFQALELRLNALTSIVAERGGSSSLIKSINQFSDSAIKSAQKRNRMVHDPISAPDDEKPEAITITARKRLSYEFSKGVCVKYESVEMEIAELYRRYLDLEKLIYIEVPPPPQYHSSKTKF